MLIYLRYLCLAAFLLVATGCADEPAPPAERSADISNSDSEPPTSINKKPQSIIEKAPQSDPQRATDNSLTLDEYIKAGMPSHDRIWSGDDMTGAAKNLQEIARKDASHLPRYKSKHSGVAFERLTADDNLDLYRNGSLPLDFRVPDALNYMQASNQILKLYLTAYYSKNSIGDSELVELLGAQLRVSVVMINLINDLMPTFDKDDPSYAVRMKGLQKMKYGMASVVAGSLQTLTESQSYRSSELKRFAGYMEATIPDILPAISDANRSETLTRLRSFANDSKMQHLKPELDSLVAAVEKSIKPDQDP